MQIVIHLAFMENAMDNKIGKYSMFGNNQYVNIYHIATLIIASIILIVFAIFCFQRFIASTSKTNETSLINDYINITNSNIITSKPLNNHLIMALLREGSNNTSKIRIIWILRAEGKHYMLDGDLYDEHLQNLSLANSWELPFYTDGRHITSHEERLAEEYTAEGRRIITTEELFKMAVEHNLQGFYQFKESNKHTLYAFYDPECKNCKDSAEMAEKISERLQEASINIFWIPVSILSQDNYKAASDLVAGKFGQPPSLVTQEHREAVDLNTAALIYASEVPAVPYFFWKGNGNYNVLLGTPEIEQWDYIIQSFSTIQNLDQN
jgi:thiol-disulfide isomerase/thioredoxin